MTTPDAAEATNATQQGTHRFVSATSIDEAVQCLAEGARPIAGGTDLVVAARSGRRSLPASLVAIDRIDELQTLAMTGSELRIGAAVTHRRLLDDPEVRTRCTALADAAGLVGSPATRNVGTIGGNVMNASPAADTAAPLVVAGATIEARSLRGTRHVPIDELWSGPGSTTLAADELCTAIVLDGESQSTGSAYLRLEYRRAMEIAVVGAAASVTLSASGAVTAVRVALSAVGPTIVSLPPQVLEDAAAPTPEAVGDAAAAAARSLSTPISDTRASDAYRREMVAVMARRAVLVAARRAAGEPIGVPANRHVGIGVALPQGGSQ